jgi:hypothetical protein
VRTPFKAPYSNNGKGQDETDLGPPLRLFAEPPIVDCHDIDPYARYWYKPRFDYALIYGSEAR